MYLHIYAGILFFSHHPHNVQFAVEPIIYPSFHCSDINVVIYLVIFLFSNHGLLSRLHSDLCEQGSSLWTLVFSLLSDHTCFLCSVSERRNSLGSDVLFLGKSHPLFDFIHELYRTESNEVRNPTPSVSIHFSQINQSKLYLFTSFHTIKIQLKVLYTLKTENKQKYTHASPWLHPLITPPSLHHDLYIDIDTQPSYRNTGAKNK